MTKKYSQNGLVFRVHKTEKYTVMSNYHLVDKSLTLKAKGLLSIMLALPPEWNFSLNGLTGLSTDGRDSVYSAIKTLRDRGYLFLEMERNEKGQFDTVYNIFENPQTEFLQNTNETNFFTDAEKPIRENRFGKSASDNIELNTKELSINNQKDDKKNLDNVGQNFKTEAEKPNFQQMSLDNVVQIGQTPKARQKIIIKNPYGEFKNVLLSDEECEKLKEIYQTKEKFDEALGILSEYKAAKGKKYKSDYAVLCSHNWVYKKVFGKISVLKMLKRIKHLKFRIIRRFQSGRFISIH